MFIRGNPGDLHARGDVSTLEWEGKVGAGSEWGEAPAIITWDWGAAFTKKTETRKTRQRPVGTGGAQQRQREEGVPEPAGLMEGSGCSTEVFSGSRMAQSDLHF